MKPVLLRQENISHGDLLLVAPGHPLPPFPVLPEMVPALPDQPDILLQPHAAQFLQRLIATLDGWKQVAAVSGFRTQEEQEGYAGKGGAGIHPEVCRPPRTQ